MAKTKTTVDSRLAPPFATLSKPAQRALVNAGIFSAEDLATRRLSDITRLHGIGPGSIPTLQAILADEKLSFTPG